MTKDYLTPFHELMSYTDDLKNCADDVLDFNSTINLLGDPNNLKVGYVGHLHKGKGIEVIASIANMVNNNVEFHIIGGIEKDINIWKNNINSKN